MIVKMNHYSFIVYHDDLSSFLERLQTLGMIDITRQSRPIDPLSKNIFDLNARYFNAIKRLNAVKIDLANQDTELIKELCKLDGKEILTKAEEYFSKKELLAQQLESTIKERNESTPWGRFEADDILKIESLGLVLHFYSIPEKSYDPKWESDYCTEILNKQDGKVYFTIVSSKNEDYSFNLAESKFPLLSYHLLDKRITEIETEIAINNVNIENIARCTHLLNNAKREVSSYFELYLAAASSTKEVDDTVAILSGFAPTENFEQIKEFLDDSNVYYIFQDAKIEDNPPIKLKNNAFARLFEPIGEMYMLPKYGELDLTPFFAPFYMLFFGLCFGDMGYGALLLIGAGLAKYKLKKMKPYLTLIQILGFGSILMASLSGVMFGAKLSEMFDLPDSIDALFFSDLKMFWFAIIFGIVQILFARLLSAIDSMIRRGWKYGMANIGWFLIITWASFSYANSMLPELSLPFWFNYATGWPGLIIVVIFSVPEGNIFARLGRGVFSLYDITGIFGDILSYIRLFGLGTAGGILGLVVNAVAFNMLSIPYFGWIFTGIMLLVGHSAVLMLSSLGAFVHPMRLTFVEFYKNSGFTGGGKAYNPLK